MQVKNVKWPEVFADLFNHLIYGGRNVIQPEELLELDTTEIFLPFDPIFAAFLTILYWRNCIRSWEKGFGKQMWWSCFAAAWKHLLLRRMEAWLRKPWVFIRTPGLHGAFKHLSDEIWSGCASALQGLRQIFGWYPDSWNELGRTGVSTEVYSKVASVPAFAMKNLNRWRWLMSSWQGLRSTHLWLWNGS